MRQVRARVRKLARFPWPVLVLGESGVGKELIARSIHEASPRQDKPFVAVNCAGMPDTLVESEFFGYRKGAFTGAENHKKGKFEEADQGMIFLDEIGEASLKFQLTLLRVLETRKITKVGGWKEEPVCARVLCATNKPVDKMMAEMRTDLFHRISAFPLYIPPLRERREDIPALATHFIRQFRREFGEHTGEENALSISEISSDALESLSRLHFYGNVRELRNVLQRAVMLADAHEAVITETHVREAVSLIPQEGTDEAAEALKWLYEWAASNQRRFWNRHRQVNKEPSEGWVGRWDIRRIHKSSGGADRGSPDNDRWKAICLTVDTVSELLADAEFESRAVIRSWARRDWLSSDKKRVSTTCKFGKRSVRVYCIRRSALEENCIRIRISV